MPFARYRNNKGELGLYIFFLWAVKNKMMDKAELKEPTWM
jgi:hypothetical protein